MVQIQKHLVIPEVTRWAALLLEAAQSAGIPENLQAAWVAQGLGVIYKESRGQPDIFNKKSKAFGLTQQLQAFYPVEPDPKKHLRTYADVAARQLKSKTGGYLPTVAFAWASGPGAVAHWVKTGDATDKYHWVATHLRYIDGLYKNQAPAYGAWLMSWLAAGAPTHTETVEVQGQTYEFQAADNVPIMTSEHIRTGYDGIHRWSGMEREHIPTTVSGKVLDLTGMPRIGGIDWKSGLKLLAGGGLVVGLWKFFS